MDTAANNAESQRNAVISAANLLMVSLLKLNRVFVPATLRWFRTRRRNWIRRSSADIARELAHTSERRRLCAGSCCGGAYIALINSLGGDTVLAKGAMTSTAYLNWMQIPPITSDDTDEAGTITVPTGSSSKSGVSVDMKVAAEHTDIEAGRHLHPATKDESGRTLIPLPPGWSEDDVYFRLRVLQEERHRAGSMAPIAYATVYFVYFTLITVVIYGTIIISIVLTSFEFETWEAVVFSFTLIATAVISEAEVLMMKKTKASKKEKSKQETQNNDKDDAGNADGSGGDGRDEHRVAHLEKMDIEDAAHMASIDDEDRAIGKLEERDDDYDVRDESD